MFFKQYYTTFGRVAWKYSPKPCLCFVAQLWCNVFIGIWRLFASCLSHGAAWYSTQINYDKPYCHKKLKKLTLAPALLQRIAFLMPLSILPWMVLPWCAGSVCLSVPFDIRYQVPLKVFGRTCHSHKAVLHETGPLEGVIDRMTEDEAPNVGASDGHAETVRALLDHICSKKRRWQLA